MMLSMLKRYKNNVTFFMLKHYKNDVIYVKTL